MRRHDFVEKFVVNLAALQLAVIGLGSGETCSASGDGRK